MERVSHIRVSSVIICMQLLNIFQIRFQHVQDDPGLSQEDQGVFCHKEIAALAAQVRDRDAAAAGGEGPVFHDHALAAGGGKAAVDQIGKALFRLKTGTPFSIIPHDTAAGAFSSRDRASSWYRDREYGN